MKPIDMWKQGSAPTVSFELFPARSEKAAESLEKAIDELAGLKPDFVSVTFGAGGSTRQGSYQLVEKLKKRKGLEVVAYFAGYGLGPDDIVSVLDSYRDLGLDTILVVRGDAPKEDESFRPHPRSFQHATEIIEFVKPQYGFCIGCTGYPEGHIEAKSKEKDLEYLKAKIDNGAQYIITNYFYDNRFFFDFIDRCEASGINVPILPGIMPIYSVKMMEMLAGLCGATITDEVYQGIAELPEGDKEALSKFGIEFAVEKCRQLLKAGVPGLHIYTMDRSSSAAGIVTTLRKQGLLK